MLKKMKNKREISINVCISHGNKQKKKKKSSLSNIRFHRNKMAWIGKELKDHLVPMALP